MNVLSLFDGISCAYVSLLRAGIHPTLYLASEVDRYAIQISRKNFPDIIHVGGVEQVVGLPPSEGYDLLIGGSPCQDLSIAKRNREGLKGKKSGLFYEYVRILQTAQPKYFILENVASMSNEAKQEITDILGVEPIMINAALVSAQNRKRLFWVGKLDEFGTYKQVVIPQPEDRGILLKDILEENVDEKYNVKSVDFIKGGSGKKTNLDFIGGIRNKDWAKDGKNYSRNFGQGDRVYSPNGKSTTLSALGGGRGAKTGLYKDGTKIRKLTPIECERLQGLPDNYTEGVSNTQRYKALGNAFNVDVVAHILSFIPKI